MMHLLGRLARREGRDSIAFLLLGRDALALFRAATRRYLHENREANVETILCAHSSAWRGRTYFEYENPLARVNQALDRLGANERIQWWPPGRQDNPA